DYKGNAFKAYKVENTESLDYDLSLIYFERKDNYHIIEFEKSNPNIDDLAISIGQPGGQNNSVTYGKVKRYTKIPNYVDDSLFEPPKFEVIQHDAPTAGGSSGGIILNDKLKLIGLHFAGS